MRLYKTRTIAADACKKGRVTMGGTTLKPSRTFHIGDVFSVRKGPITYTYRVLQLCENRVGAKLVPDYLRDQTAPEQLELLEENRIIRIEEVNHVSRVEFTHDVLCQIAKAHREKRRENSESTRKQ